jgi:nicotinate-nucleotide pyrophosphorylase (carboxylating)
MNKEYQQVVWDERLEDDCRQLVRLAIREDLDRQFDLTTVALIDGAVRGECLLVARETGVICGLPAVHAIFREMEVSAVCSARVEDAAVVQSGTVVAQLAGSARDLLTAERLVLNLVGRLSGVATVTRQYVECIAGTSARLYDTRKTTPGWRRLEKYAVRCGGAMNHRTGLFDGLLIKDNHLALIAAAAHGGLSPADAVARARQRLAQILPDRADSIILEIEVDSLDQLRQVLPQCPDIVLLDNMPVERLREAVALRDEFGATTQLEASGGVNLHTVREIALTGVDRISVGALTHAAPSLDVALDWTP